MHSENPDIDQFNDHRHTSGQNLYLRGKAMSTMQASEFKAKCLALMDYVARTGKTIVVTKNGKPVAELRPHRPPRAKSLIGLHKGQIKIKGDIIAPVSAKLWESLK
jgi:prevent-host-death family protein